MLYTTSKLVNILVVILTVVDAHSNQPSDLEMIKFAFFILFCVFVNTSKGKICPSLKTNEKLLNSHLLCMCFKMFTFIYTSIHQLPTNIWKEFFLICRQNNLKRLFSLTCLLLMFHHFIFLQIQIYKYITLFFPMFFFLLDHLPWLFWSILHFIYLLPVDIFQENQSLRLQVVSYNFVFLNKLSLH